MCSVVVIVIQQLYAIMNNCKSNSKSNSNCKSNSVLLFLGERELYYIVISI